ncbi:restriction endonuclease [Jeotgalibacillus salarius]|uniref:Restriction endonuclease n=1 Tax=Jeotgalibacillus salarius TaxID=546023 RepID=A0A4Y8LAL7_9BACL|nr:restriction endonuclease [Jeotgalibacillus salarius]TFD99417.1 restriction endonuclease [Jeotgalibacillus salarius]
MYQVEIRHDGLNKYRLIKGNDRHVVEQKAAVQIKDWDERWEKQLAILEKKKEKEMIALEKEEKKEYAAQQTAEALETLKALDNVLIHTLDIDDKIDWDDLRDDSSFLEPYPIKPMPLHQPSQPLKKDFEPTFSFTDKIFSKNKEKKAQEAEQKFHTAMENWKSELERIKTAEAEALSQYEVLLSEWEKNKKEFELEQKETNDAVELQKQRYLNNDPLAIEEYCDMVLSNSEYPDLFPKEYDLEYISTTRTLLVEYNLPDIEAMPKLKEVKYIANRDEYNESYLTEAAVNKIYEKLLYDTTLRTIHELYEGDVSEALDAIVFNGWVNTLNKATGNYEKKCILSVQANKDAFLAINLEQVDPKICFKNLKGVGSSKLSSLTPIAPILNINREDTRFVDSYDVAASMNQETNLAAMDWQDFEHLIRELFEKEFNSSGGEVKITQASKDGGVDAVAFDPDPIRGGKIVIQAKRYTNVVGVSAVRDLYGTVLNEGATKGILVSTADYGPDAYSFANDKPITLLNGSNLLHLLEKHGHRAKIDLKEAKRILKQN